MEAALASTKEKVARATMAAILAAAKGTCACETCRILKVVADEIKGEFLTS
jgi:hypothetical protein